MKVLGALMLAAALALSACDGADDGGAVRGPTDGKVPDDGPVVPGDKAPPLPDAPGFCTPPVPQNMNFGLGESKTFANGTYLCYVCGSSTSSSWEPPADGCLFSLGGPQPVLCVTSATTGCK